MNLRKIIREEMDDLQWIRDVESDDVFFKNGDRVMVHNRGKVNAYVEWLGMFGENYLSGDYGKNITGEVVYVDDYDPDYSFHLSEDNTGHVIAFPSISEIKRISQEGDYMGLDLFYEPIR